MFKARFFVLVGFIAITFFFGSAVFAQAKNVQQTVVSAQLAQASQY